MVDRKRIPPDHPAQADRPAEPDRPAASERRRVATVVHDDRGNASVEWQNAPEGHERTHLELLDEAPRSGGRERSYDPYSRNPVPRRTGPTTSGRPQRTDLRKLSEWIKMMRELEARRARGEEVDEGSEAGNGAGNREPNTGK